MENINDMKIYEFGGSPIQKMLNEWAREVYSDTVQNDQYFYNLPVCTGQKISLKDGSVETVVFSANVTELTDEDFEKYLKGERREDYDETHILLVTKDSGGADHVRVFGKLYLSSMHTTCSDSDDVNSNELTISFQPRF